MAVPFLLFGCSQQQNRNSDCNKTAEELVILHVNDLHGQLDAFGRLAFIADSMRAIHANVLLFSAGDIFSGNPVSDRHAMPGYPMIDLMNRCGFAASALGNHEFDYGPDSLRVRMLQADFPFLCANITDPAGKLPLLREAVPVETKAGQEIWLFGLVQVDDNGIPSTHPDNLQGFSFSQPVETGLAWINENEGEEALILLSHMGYPADTALAARTPLPLLIIGGHSHTLLEHGQQIGQSHVVQTGAYMKMLGIIHCKLEDGKITTANSGLVPLDGPGGRDVVIDSIIDLYNTNPELMRVAGVAGADFNGKAPLAALMADAVREAAGTELAFHNHGGTRMLSLPAGEISLKDIYTLDPFGNAVTLISLSKKQIEELIIYAYHKKEKIELEASGLSYKLWVKSDGTVRAELFAPDGSPLPEKTYTVALNSYLTGSWPVGKTGKVKLLTISTTEALVDYLKANSPVAPNDYEGRSSVQMRE